VIALEYEEEDKQDDERRRFEEGDAKQALVHQHVALPPDMNCRLREPEFPGSLPEDGTEPSLELHSTLTCYFLNGQGHLWIPVLSRIMAEGANTRGTRTDTGR
jgi:hypothetical protein